MFSERYNPWMRQRRIAAENMRATRTPMPEAHPAIQAEREAFAIIGSAIGTLRTARDEAIAATFSAIFEPGQHWPGKPEGKQ